MKATQPITAVVFIVFLSAGPAPGVEQGLGSLLTDDGGRLALVEAETTKVGVPARPGLVVKAELKVTCIYIGPKKELDGLTFVEETGTDIPVLGDPSYFAGPLLKLGEKGLWVLATNRDGQWISSRNYRKCNYPNYKQLREWADEIVRLSKMKVAERLRAAKSLCSHKTPELAMLGIEVLFGAYEPDAIKAGVPEFIEELPTNAKVTIAALLRADSMLTRDSEKKWADSPQRKLYLKRFEEIVPEEISHELISHLASFPVGPKQLEAWQVIGRIAANPKQAMPVREYALDRLAKYLQVSGERDPAFDVLTGIFKSLEAPLRIQVAKPLAQMPRNYTRVYGPAQLDVLRGLLKDEPDVEIKKLLQSAIDAPSKK